MVEPGRSAAARETKKTTSAAAAGMKKRLMMSKKKQVEEGGGTKSEKQSSRQCTAEAESPTYRLALRSLFSCRNSHGHQLQQPESGSLRSKSKLGSICKLKDDSRQLHQRPAAEETTGEACKRRASVSGGGSERCVSDSKQQLLLPRGGSSSSSSGGSSFRAGMQLRRLSGCYECHMVVDPVGGSMRVVCPCPDCGEVFVRQESLQRHQSIRHAVCELGADDSSRNIIEIIFQSSWLKKQVCRIERILKVQNTGRTLGRFEEYRDAVKARAAVKDGKKHYPRCTADGNELLRFHCASLACSLGLDGATHLCGDAGAACAACAIIRDGFNTRSGGVRTTATSGRAHDDDDAAAAVSSRAMLVCRVIAGRVKRPPADDSGDGREEEEDFDSIAGSSAPGLYSNLEELQVFNPTAILPCFVVVYKAAPA